MQVTTEYNDWIIAINKTGDTTVVHAYSKTIPVKQLTADTIEDIKEQINKGGK